jgi:DNA sulfur modification protein DndB
MSANYVPAIKSQMGDWTYYITKMKFGEVASQVELAEDIHCSKSLDEAIQRDISNRVKDMTEFLLSEPQRFYGSLVVSIYQGDPKFYPLTIDEKNGIVDSVDHSFGLLKMDGSQTYFALDGQHRLESIKNAVKENPDLKSEEISVLVLKHDSSKEGMVRTRRLFTRLNRYAKPTDGRTNIAIDEDDCVAINTRELVKKFKPFKEIIKEGAGKQISNSDKDNKYFTTLVSLYETNIELCSGFMGFNLDKKFLSKRPEDNLLDDMYYFLKNTWNLLIEKITVFKEITQGEKPGVYRKPDGGNVWMRPISQLIFATFIKRVLLNGGSVNQAIDFLIKTPCELTDEPWVNIIWNPDTKKIVGAKSERNFIVEVLCHISELAIPSINKDEIDRKYSAYHKVDFKDININFTENENYFLQCD